MNLEQIQSIADSVTEVSRVPIDAPWWYGFLPIGTGVVATWMLIWCIKYTYVVFDQDKPANKWLFLSGLFFGFVFGAMSFWLLIDDNPAFIIASGFAAMILNQGLWKGLEGLCRGQKRLHGLYAAMRCEKAPEKPVVEHRGTTQDPTIFTPLEDDDG